MNGCCIGVTGCIGSGKTTVTSMLADITGFYPICLDQLGHQAYEEAEIRKQVINHFHLGQAVSTGESIRKRISEVVFCSETEKKWLENLLWPYMIQKTKKHIREHQKCIIEGVILYPAELDRFCRCVLQVQTKKTVLIERLIGKGVSHERINQVFSTQLNMLKPLRRTKIPQIVVRNDQTIEVLYDALVLLWEKKLRFFFEEEKITETRQ